MSVEKKVLCTICARGGSKGVKNKNIRSLAGVPLIAHTIKVAQDSNLFSYIAVSSDSQDILDAAGTYGADELIKRPDDLASDTAGKIPAIKHAALSVEESRGETFDYFFDLDATSPLRIVDDLKGVYELLNSGRYNNIITGAPARRSPYFNLVEKGQDGYVDLAKKSEKEVLRRQDAPECYDMNASIYAWTRESFLQMKGTFEGKTGIFVMPEERSVDIDSELDFDIVEMMMRKRT